MPSALMVDKLGATLTVEAAAQFDPEILSSLKQEGSLVDVVRTNLDLSDNELAYLESVPKTLREGMRAIVAQAVTMGKAVHIQYSPAYEFGIQAWDYGEAVSVHLSGPYPEGFERPDFANE
jgi:hypothetical protein